MSKDAPLRFKRGLSGLSPADRRSEDALQGVAPGSDVWVTLRRPRNAKHHAKYWVLCTLIADNLDGATAEDVSDVIKLRTGHVRRVATKQGVHLLPASISFAQMDQTAFEGFFDRAVGVVCADIIPGINRADLEREIMELLA